MQYAFKHAKGPAISAYTGAELQGYLLNGVQEKDARLSVLNLRNRLKLLMVIGKKKSMQLNLNE